MSSFKFIRQATVLAAALCCSAVFAADNQNMAVSATVSGVCKLTAVPALSFGALDPSSTANGAGTATVEYKCTKGTAPSSFSVGGSTTGSLNSALGALTSPDTIAYSITWAPPSGTGTGFGTGSTATSVVITGTIPNANYVNVKADTYTDVVAIVINN